MQRMRNTKCSTENKNKRVKEAKIKTIIQRKLSLKS
jgi:hypothetical protein